MTLYKSHIAPDGSGTPYTANVSVASWQDANGGSADAPTSGSIAVTFTEEGESTAAATVNLSSSGWSGTANGLKKGTNYTVTYAGDGTNVLGVGSAVVNGTNITLTGVVPAATHTVKVQINNNDWYYNGVQVINELETSTAALRIWFSKWREDVNETALGKIILSGHNNITSTISVGDDPWGNANSSLILEYNISNIGTNLTLSLNFADSGLNEHYPQQVELSGGGTSSGSSFTPADPSTLYQGNSTDYAIPDVANMTVVESVTLNSGALAGLWAYEWASLPDSDTNGNLYYYVKETGHTGSTVTVGEPEYDFEFRDTEPKSITKVKITNIVKGGELDVTKAATFSDSTTAFAAKTYSFTVKDQDTGKYLQNTSGTLGSGKHWFSLKSGDIVTFPNLPVGTYIVEEDEAGAAIGGYSLSASGSVSVTINSTTPTTATLTNDYTKEYGSITVEKAALVSNGTSTSADTTVENKTVTIGLFDAAPTAESTTANTRTITLNASGTGSASFTGLELGQTYYIYELDASGHPALLTGGESRINGVAYTVTQDKTSAALSTTVKTATVNVTNTREELKGKLTITKTFDGDHASALTTEQKNAISFAVSGPDGYTATKTYAEIFAMENNAWTLENLDPGTYTVTESGENPNSTAYTLETTYSVDSSAYTATNAVQISAGNVKTLDIKNTYTENPGSLKIIKTTTGDNAPNTEFTFNVTLTAPEGGTLNATYDTVRTGTGAGTGTQAVTSGTAFTVTLHGDDTWQINGLPAGTTYSVTEDSEIGWTNTVMADATASIVAGQTKEASFTNVYSEIVKAPQATKVLLNRDWKDGETFTFSIVPADATTTDAISAGKIVMANPATATATESAPTATFGDITFKDEGTFYFTIKENEGSETGMTYSSKEVKVKVDVAKANGVLSATMQYTDVKNDAGDAVAESYSNDAKTFTNTYDTSTTAHITGTKVFTNGTIRENQFSFTISSDDSNAPLPSQETVSAATDGSITFGDMTYTIENAKDGTKEGTVWTKTYTYKVVENAPSDPNFTDEERTAGTKVINGIKYDTCVKTVTVTVTYDESTGVITATPNPATLSTNFVNEQLGSLQITKNIQKNGTTDTTATGTFYYAVYSKAYNASANPAQVAVRTGSITIETSDNGTKTITEADLPYGTYYVYELDGVNGTPIVSSDDGVRKFINSTVYIVTGSGTTATVGENAGTVILNNNYETVDIEVNKKWAPMSTWPTNVASVTVQLQQSVNGGTAADISPAKTATITADNMQLTQADVDAMADETQKTAAQNLLNQRFFRDLPKYDDSGNLITYSVIETALTAVSGATANLSDFNVTYMPADGTTTPITVINTQVIGSVEVTKTFSGIDASQIPADFKIEAAWTVDGTPYTSILWSQLAFFGFLTK